MKNASCVFCVLVGSLLILRQANAAVPLYYSVTDLGTLSNISGSDSSGEGINENGQVAGQSNYSTDEPSHAFLYSNGTMMDLGTLGGSYSHATAINETAQVVGSAYINDDNRHAFLHSNGSMQDLGTLGGVNSDGTDINDSGQVSGYYQNSDGNYRAFLYSDGSMQDLGTLGGSSSGAYGINNNGQVVGYSYISNDTSMHIMLYSNGTMQDLGTLHGRKYNAANEINDIGQIVGYGYNSNNQPQAFLYSNGSMQDINTLGANASTAYGINNQGQVVGAFHTLATQWQAFLYSNGLMQDLNSLVDPNWAGTLTAAYDINESGQIITNGYYEFGETHAFVLTPVFPPPNLYLLSPNGVETYHVGTSETITWESEGEVYNVQLSYSSDNGSTWNTINAVANTGNTTWTIPNAPSSECILKISDADDPNIFDTSDDVFTIQHRCYEQITGDLDGDCIVGLSDFAIIANNWMNQGKVFVRAFPLDESPNWTAEGQWEFGHPLGLGGVSYGYPDPSSGYTGQNVYGVNLAGDYNTEIGGPYYLATEPIGCTRYDNMKVSFMSWLNIDSSDYVRCRFEVSANGTDWVVLWNNNFEPITDENWSKMEFDISEYADDNPSLYLRWKYEVIENRAYPYSGWNIDDIELWGTL